MLFPFCSLVFLICAGIDGEASKLGSPREGLMQLQYSGRMGYICDDEWDEIDAEVACAEFKQHDSATYDTTPEGE